MPSLACLMLLGATAAPPDAFPAPQETELGTVEFAAGPARGSARFYLSGSEPRVDVVIRNDGAAPIWWRGAGMGCVSSHWIVEPVASETGKTVSGGEIIGCSFEKDVPVTPEKLSQWQIAPGQSAKAWTAQPFDPERMDGPYVLPALDRWTWCHEFTLPRDTTPATTMDFTDLALVLAWSRATGPRVFLDDPAVVHYSHFQPFADEPFQRGPGPHPIRFGPLRGTAELRHENGWPIVDLTLTNPTERELWWSARGAGGTREWGFSELEFNEGAFEEDLLLADTTIRRAFGEMPLGDDARFAPGQTRIVSIAPFSESLGSRSEWLRASGPQGMQRWTFLLSSTWPAGASSEAPRFLPARLLLHFDAVYGFDVGLQTPIALMQGDVWRPFNTQPAESADSESIRFGSLALLVHVNLLTGYYGIELCNDGSTPQYWTIRAPDLKRWVQMPGNELNPLALQGAPFKWPVNDRQLDEADRKRTWIGAGGHTRDGGSFLDTRAEEVLVSLLSKTPWDFIRPFAVPQQSAPERWSEFGQGWLRLRWNPERGIEVLAGSEWPF